MTQQSLAFTTLAGLAKQTRDNARGLPGQVEIKPHWSGIGFSLFGRHFVAPMGEVSEMLDIPHYTQLPGVQSWVRGLANVRGRLLPLTDTAVYLGGHLESPRRQRRILVIEVGEIYSGLIVDAVYGMQHFPVDSYVPEMVGIEHAAMLPYLQGSFREDTGRDWAVFSPWAMLRDERFFQAAMAHAS